MELEMGAIQPKMERVFPVVHTIVGAGLVLSAVGGIALFAGAPNLGRTTKIVLTAAPLVAALVISAAKHAFGRKAPAASIQTEDVPGLPTSTAKPGYLYSVKVSVDGEEDSAKSEEASRLFSVLNACEGSFTTMSITGSFGKKTDRFYLMGNGWILEGHHPSERPQGVFRYDPEKGLYYQQYHETLYEERTEENGDWYSTEAGRSNPTHKVTVEREGENLGDRAPTLTLDVASTTRAILSTQGRLQAGNIEIVYKKNTQEAA